MRKCSKQGPRAIALEEKEWAKNPNPENPGEKNWQIGKTCRELKESLTR
jgi:hypothetical protein